MTNTGGKLRRLLLCEYELSLSAKMIWIYSYQIPCFAKPLCYWWLIGPGLLGSSLRHWARGGPGLCFSGVFQQMFLVISTKILIKRHSGEYLQHFRTFKPPHPSFGYFWLRTWREVQWSRSALCFKANHSRDMQEKDYSNCIYKM